MPATEIRFVVEDLALERSGRPLLRGLSFALAGGEALTVTGPNGSGKSTLLRALAGLFRPANGKIRVVDASGSREDIDAIAQATHYFGHSNALKPSLTALENVAFWTSLLGGGAGGMAPLEALNRLGVERLAELPAGYLSAGQKRRVAFARLLTASRPIWLLDEPATALDAESQARMEKILADHLAAGGAAVIATHARFGAESAAQLRLGL